MQLRYLKTIHPPAELVEGKFQKITALAWSPNSYRLAAATVDRNLILYDGDTGEHKETFPTKPADKTSGKNYLVRALEFSPDSQKLAVAQSDNIVFIYKLGATWAEKKTICNKFLQPAAVTCMCWPAKQPNAVVFATMDGKVRIGLMKSNKTQILYGTDSYVVSMCASPDGTSFVSGHLDGSIYKFTFPEGSEPHSHQLLTTAPFVPYCLGWGEHIVAAGNSGLVQFFDLQGGQAQSFDYSSDEKMKEFSCCGVSPSGQTVVLGNYDKFYTYVFNLSKEIWEEAGVTRVDNLYTVTAARWKADGARLCTGSLCGAIDLYDACMRKYTYRGKYEFTYTSPSSAIVKKLSNGARMGLKSKHGCEIKKINIYRDRFVIVHTTDTLMAGDMKTGELSEVPWNHMGGNRREGKSESKRGHAAAAAADTRKEKFFFDNEFAAMIYSGGELTLIEYGKSEILGSCRTEHISPHSISLRLNETKAPTAAGGAAGVPVKKIAFLLDVSAVRVMDLNTGHTEGTHTHESRIDWLELNQSATKLLFRDKKRALHLYDIATQTRITLLPYCNYVQWVPDSDVVVAQSRQQLCVWYSIDHPSDITTIAIKGDVESIERAGGRTEVIVDEGLDRASYPLDESLIAFGSAVEAHDFPRAVSILEKLSSTASGYEAMWSQLSKLSLEVGDYIVAERCASALGDVSKRKFLGEINAIIEAQGGNKNHFMVKAKVAQLKKEFKRAEQILLTQGAVDEAINMYRQVHKWPDALQVSEMKNHPGTGALRQEYFQYLISTRQEELAGELKEREGEYSSALQLYLRGGFPVKAASLIRTQGYTQDPALLEQVADALMRTKAYEKAGEFLESLKLNKRALEAYCRGNAWAKAVELCRHASPGQVVRLEEEWGDYLAGLKQWDAACNHYMQAGSGLKAVNAAVEAGQWTKAVGILDSLEPGAAKPYLRKIAQRYASTKNYHEAEKYFVQGGVPQEAVNMYMSAGLWEKAHAIAQSYMSETEVHTAYVKQAKLMESQGKFKEAERLYLQVEEADEVIAMYRKNRQFDAMMAVVVAHRPQQAHDAWLELGHMFETEGNFKLAETHYLKAKGWKPTLTMYRDNDLWEDALRIAKGHGGQEAYKETAYEFAKSVGGDAGGKLLAKRGLADLAVDYAVERREWPEAFALAEKYSTHKLADVHYNHGMALEDDGRFEKAEEEFLKAKRPKDAVEMYTHQQEWDHAMRVAEAHLPSSIPEILEAQARVKQEQKQFPQAEALYISAKKPEVAVRMYKDAQMFDDAIRIAKVHLPRLVTALQSEKMEVMARTPVAETGDWLIQQAQIFTQQKQYSQAIDQYLKVTKVHSTDLDSLCRVWENAVTLALDHVHSRINEVADVVGRRMLDVEHYEHAAEVYASVDDFKKAVEAFLAGKMYDKARQLVAQQAPHLRDMVERANTTNAIATGSLGDLAPDVAISEHARRGEWDKVQQLAAKLGEGMVSKYTTMQAHEMAKVGRYREALQVLHVRGPTCAPANFDLYKRIAQCVLAETKEEKREAKDLVEEKKLEAAGDGHFELREVLYKLVTELKELDPSSQHTLEFERLLLIAHYSALRTNCMKSGMKPIAAKLGVSLLRYCNNLLVDRAFFNAGFGCREANLNNMAFVFFNRFVDLTDLIEKPDNGDIDNTDFLDTDIPSPEQMRLPRVSAFTESQREDIRDWVLDKAMGKDVSQVLSTRVCEKCAKPTYEANLRCHHCQGVYEPCIVTGYPIQRGQRVQCTRCRKPAIRDFWNQYVLKWKACPFCEQTQQANYS